MSTVIESNNGGGKDFAPHPEGSFMAVCADVFTKEMPNRYKGQTDKNGNVDNRETVRKVCVAFLTTEVIEINGELKPRYASWWGAATFGSDDYPSNLRKFIKAWQPQVKDWKKVDLDQFIGKGAWLTITHSVDKNGKTWANVAGAMQPPPGSPIPAIPADFVRHKDKDAQPAQAKASAPVASAGDESDLPF